MHFAKALPGKARARILIELVAGASIAFMMVPMATPAQAQMAYETCGSVTAGAQRLSCFRKHEDPVALYLEACLHLTYESAAGTLKRPFNSRTTLMLSVCGGNPDKATCEITVETLAKDNAPKNILICTGGG